MNELFLSDDEIDLIWHLPYITEQDRLEAIARVQVDIILETLLFKGGICEADRQPSPAVAVAGR